MTQKKPRTALPTSAPSLVTPQDVTVAYVRTTGDPSDHGPDVMKALYGAAYALKFQLKERGVIMPMGMPRARWDFVPDERSLGEDRPTSGALAGEWALIVPDNTAEADLVQKDPRYPVRIGRWTYGECAWIMHHGGYDEELPTIRTLLQFVAENGRRVSGKHEEWYLSGPNTKVPRTVILYPVTPVEG